jgi:hypothetical protein
MEISKDVFVGEEKKWINEIIEREKEMKVNEGNVKGKEFGNVI